MGVAVHRRVTHAAPIRHVQTARRPDMDKNYVSIEGAGVERW